MPRKSISQSQPKDFEPKKKNPISLGDDSNIDNDFKPFRIGGIDTGLEFKKGEIKSSASNFITLQETTEILNVTKIKGNRSGSQEVPNFIFQNPDPVSADSGLWVNVATGGLSILRSYGSAAHMVQQSESSFFFVGGADDGDLVKWQRGTSWLTPDSTAMQLDLYNTSLSIFDRSDGGDYFKIDVTTHGATTISTVDDDATAAHLTLDTDGSIILDPADGKFIAKNNGTEFSATDSAYAGMALGYTYLQPSGSGVSHALQTSFTVEDSTHQISFVVPPSGNVEIEATAFFDRTSTSDVTIYAGLSDNATYNSVGVGHEYDFTGALSDDEIDDEIITFKWCVTGLTAGTSTTYYIGFKSSDASAVYLKYGIRTSHSKSHHPFIIKAMALPAAIYDGS